MKKKRGYSIILVLLLVVCGLYMYTHSNFVIAQSEAGVSTVSNWSFKVNGETEDFGTIDLAGTINQSENSKVIMPGTDGAFNIVLDGSKSGKALDYDIKMDVVSKPTNMHFYTDSECTKMIPEENGVLKVSGSINAENIKDPLTKTIYWKWAYETGKTEEEIRENDIIDTKDQGKEALIKIAVTGTQK